jgi:hypothetical protein
VSIVTEIERIKSNISSAYTACEEKGATMPSVLNSANLMDCIASITGGGAVHKQFTYHGRCDNLALARRYLAGASIGGNALIGGGVNGSSSTSAGSNIVDVYSENLTKSTATTLTNGTRMVRAGSNSKYAIFAGGMKTGSYNTAVDTVDTYDKDLVKSTATNLSVARSWWMDEVETLGEYVFFGNGYDTNQKVTDVIDTYDENLVRNTINNGSATYLASGIARAGEYIIYPRYGAEMADTYTKDLVRGTASQLSPTRSAVISVSNKSYGIFAGGSLNATGTGTASNVVDIYDKNLVKGTASSLSTARYYGTGIQLGEYAVIAGGATASTDKNETSVVEAFDNELVKVISSNLSESKRYLASATAGDKYAIIAGGQYDGVSKATVDAYELVG